jgi:hypothetical protein
VAASLAAVRGSALWAAWGDALGYVTELAWTERAVVEDAVWFGQDVLARHRVPW